jgi:general secretion pathway protein G
MGPDKASVPPLTAKQSQDDIIWANDGEFVGPAANF